MNKVSGSSHFSNRQCYKNDKNIVPNESNGFSLYGRSSKDENKLDNNDYYSNYLTNNKSIKKNKDESYKKIYNSKLYTPFYDLIENLNNNDNLKNNGKNKTNNISNNHFLNSNHIIDIYDNPKNIATNEKNINNNINIIRPFKSKKNSEKYK